jgi:DMSO/TMAO reductase YedYZ molybdopterin-dependent catalytic subunit
MLTRRSLIGAGGGLLLAGCDGAVRDPDVLKRINAAEGLTMAAQRLIGREALAREFPRSAISPIFKANGSTDPRTLAYLAHRGANFATWRVAVDGLVARPLMLSLADLAAMPERRQITRHDCVEGWSAIGEWTGPMLAPILKAAGLGSRARYIVFHCADIYGQSGSFYYESIDLIDAFHPQTILATHLNGGRLPVANGAPVRLRVERQLGYKHAKYVERIEARESLAGLGLGKGGFWPDRGYEWYAGI